MLANFKKIKQKIFESAAYKTLRAVLSSCFHYIHKDFLWGLFKPVNEKFFKFLFVGAMNTVFAYCIYAIFVTIGIKPGLALFFQYIIGVLWNFKTTGSLVFKNRDNRLLAKFIASYIFTFLVNSVFLNFLTNYLNSYLAQAILVLPVAVLSFLIFKFFVFR